MFGEEGVWFFDFGFGQVQVGILDGLLQFSWGCIDVWILGYVVFELFEGVLLLLVVDLYVLVCVFYELVDGCYLFCCLFLNQVWEQGLECQLCVFGYLFWCCWLVLCIVLSFDFEWCCIGVCELQEVLGVWCFWLVGVFVC